MTYDELVSLKDKINLALWNSAEWQDVVNRIAERRIIMEIVTPVTPQATPDMDEVDAETFRTMYACELGSANLAEYVPLKDMQGNPMSFKDIPRNIGLFRKFMAQLAGSISASASSYTVSEM